LLCPPDLKILLHLDLGFLQEMLKMFDLGFERPEPSETLLVTKEQNTMNHY